MSDAAGLPPPFRPITPADVERLRLDPRVIGFENAAHLAGDLQEALTTVELRRRARNPVAADDIVLLLATDNPHVMGETGKVVREYDDPETGRPMRLVGFTTRQTVAMAELINDALVGLAHEARTAYLEAGIDPSTVTR